MIDLEALMQNTQAQAVKVVEVNPEALRELANRLETMAEASLPGESVLCPMSASVTAIYKPKLAIKPFTSTEVISFETERQN